MVVQLQVSEKNESRYKHVKYWEITRDLSIKQLELVIKWLEALTDYPVLLVKFRQLQISEPVLSEPHYFHYIHHYNLNIRPKIQIILSAHAWILPSMTSCSSPPALRSRLLSSSPPPPPLPPWWIRPDEDHVDSMGPYKAWLQIYQLRNSFWYHLDTLWPELAICYKV